MYIELLCRFPKQLNKEEMDFINEELSSSGILPSDEDYEIKRDELMEQFKSFEYANMVVDLNEVFAYNNVDGTHYSLRFLNGSMFTFKGDYEKFKIAFQQVTQKFIHGIEEETNKE